VRTDHFIYYNALMNVDHVHAAYTQRVCASC